MMTMKKLMATVPAAKKNLILYDRNGKFMSVVELTDQSRARLRAVYCCTLTETTDGGNEKWTCISPWGNSVQGKKLAAEYKKKYGADPLDTPTRKAA